MTQSNAGAIASARSQRRMFWLIVAALAFVLSVGLPVAGYHLVNKFRMILYQQVMIDNAALSRMFEHSARVLKTKTDTRDEWLKAVQSNVEGLWDEERGYVCLIDSSQTLQAAPGLSEPMPLSLEDVFLMPANNDGTSFLQEQAVPIADLLKRPGGPSEQSGRVEKWNGQVVDFRVIEIENELWLIGVHQYESAIQARLKELIPFIVLLGTALFIAIVLPFGVFSAWLISNHESERQRYIERIETHSRELQELQSEKNRLYARLSHDLRAPLNSVLGASELVAEGNYGAVTDKQVKAMSSIERNVGALLKLIEGILQLARLESGHVAVKAERFRLNELLHELCENLRPLAERKSLDLHCETAGDFQLECDRDKLYLILQNLINNALQFTDQGSVSVILKQRENNEIAIHVTDTGPGIAEDEQQAIFKEFERGTVSSSSGTGLGLAITKELTSLLKGRLELDSKLGEGSTFTVILPSSSVRTDL